MQRVVAMWETSERLIFRREVRKEFFVLLYRLEAVFSSTVHYHRIMEFPGIPDQFVGGVLNILQNAQLYVLEVQSLIDIFLKDVRSFGKTGGIYMTVD